MAKSNNKPTTTKVITLVYDLDKDKEPALELLWQQYLAGEVTLTKVLDFAKKWQVESLLK